MSCRQNSKNEDEVQPTLAVHGGYILKNSTNIEVIMHEVKMLQEKWG
jgi:hypothetical protein